MTSSKTPNYRITEAACYLAMITQAFVITITALLFVGLKDMYGLGFEHLGILAVINYGFQFLFDIIASYPADRFGLKPMLKISAIFIVAGMLLFIFTPQIIPKGYEFYGFAAATAVFAASGGILEAVVSPTINNLPLPNSEKRMSLTHSMYGFGVVIVVVITSLLVHFLGYAKWQIIMGIWLVLPVIVFVLLFFAPVVDKKEDGQRQKFKDYAFKPFFILCFLGIVTGGAAENIMSQWASSFMEKSLEVPKLLGDILGVAMFALCLALGRFIHSRVGNKRISMSAVMTIGCAFALVFYLVIVFVNIKPIVIIACALCGFAVSLLWPGTIIVASSKYPAAGAVLFGMLACGGDIGSAVSNWMTGKVTDAAAASEAVQQYAANAGMTIDQVSLKIGLLAATGFVAACLLINLAITLMIRKDKKKGFPIEVKEERVKKA